MRRNVVIATCIAVLAQVTQLVNAQSGKCVASFPDAVRGRCSLRVRDLSERNFALPAKKLLPLPFPSKQQPVCLSSSEIQFVTLAPEQRTEVPVPGESPKFCGIMYDGCTRIYVCTRG